MSEMKRAIWMSLFALMISVAFVSGVMAQQKPTATPSPAAQQSKLEKFSGTVEKVDSAKKEVFVKINKEEMTFSLGEKAKIMEGKKELSLNDLKKGMNVSVEYTKEGNKLTAESINVSPKNVSQMTPSEKSASKTEKKW
jgi:Cu/Ag efflux protein CusF